MTIPLELNRSQILTYRRHVASLNERQPRGQRALQLAARAGLQDSMPRAALLSIHARMASTEPRSWEDPSLVQIWGPRFNTYVVAKRDLAVFTLGRLPDESGSLKRIQAIAAQLQTTLAGRRMLQGTAARGMKVKNANLLRYAAPTGTFLIRWDGSRQPEIWNVPPPEMDRHEARLELARRYLQVFGPATPETFATWAGIGPRSSIDTFKALGKSLTRVHTPVGEAWILSRDEALFRMVPGSAAPARLLPSGDTWFLLQGTDRRLLIPNERQRRTLWTTRVWPGALLVEGETVGTWRRAGHVVTIQSWRRLSHAQHTAVVTEATSMPLPGIERPLVVRWDQR